MEKDPNKIKMAKTLAISRKKAEAHNVAVITANLADVLIIEAIDNPNIQRELLTTLIRTLKTLGLSEGQAVENIKAITSHSVILSILDEDTNNQTFRN